VRGRGLVTPSYSILHGLVKELEIAPENRLCGLLLCLFSAFHGVKRGVQMKNLFSFFRIVLQ
jgi:hypothetical protein